MNLLKSLILIFLLSPMVLKAQIQLNWPEDIDKAKNAYTLMNDNVKQNNYKDALPHWRWLYLNAPDLDNQSFSLYKQGEKIFKDMVKNTEDKTLQKAYQDSVLLNFQERINKGDSKKDVMDRMGFFLFPYWINRTEKRQDLYDTYKEIMELNGEASSYVAPKYFFKTIYYMNQKEKVLSDEQIIADYDYVLTVIEPNIAKGGSSAPKWEKVKNDIDNDFSKLVDIDCDFITKNWVPKYKANPEDLVMAKKIFNGMLTAKCTDDPVWMETGIHINSQEPSFGLAKNLGKRMQAMEKYDESIKYFDEAANLTESADDKAEMYFLSALSYFKKGSKSTARSFAQKAASTSSSQASSAYSLIGDMYMNSFNDCKNDNIVESRAVFIAAYNMYQRAGDSSKMSSAKEQFPSIEEIFTLGKKEGDSVTISCWINETVQLQRRPQ